MTVSNGTIEFSRRIRTGEFEHKDAKVALTFVCDSTDERSEIARVGAMAVEQAMSMVGEKITPAAVEAVRVVGDLNMPAFKPEPSLQIVPTGAAIVAPPSVLLNAVGEPMKPVNGVAVDPMAAALLPGGPALPAVSAQPATEPAASAAPSSETVVSPTDKDLVDAITAKNAKLLQAASEAERPHVPVKLHKLVGEFVPPPAKVQAIPAERRAEFLEKLAAL